MAKNQIMTKSQIETFRVRTDLKEGLQVEANTRGHKLIMDEPEELGGTDKGMNPVELVLSALGGCLSICASLFSKSYGIELKDFYVELEGDLDLRGFKGKKNVDPGFQDIRFTIYIESDSPEEKIIEFIEGIEARCPVSDSLKRNININGKHVKK